MPQRMNEVTKPESYLSGAGAGRNTFEESLAGLSWVSASSEDIVAGLGGIGRLSGATGGNSIPKAMDAIIANAAEMKAKVGALNKARKEEASKDPIFAVKLKAAIERTSGEGTNEAKAVMAAMETASKKAQVAKKEEAAAKVLLAQGDRRGAAAKATASLTTAREAMTLATRAEKTRLTRSLDKVAKTLEAQANYIEGIVRTETSRAGESGRSNALMANAQALRAQASQLRAQSAVVATLPNTPDNAPSQKRVAELANRFNVRTSRSSHEGLSRATISVLSDIADSALAQANDIDGAVAYYGNDSLGILMADIEFGTARAMHGLHSAVNGIGYAHTLPALAQAERALDNGVRAANIAYANAVIPAFTGGRPGTEHMQAGVSRIMGVSGLAGIGALGGAWEDWCSRRIGPGASPETINDRMVASKYSSLDQCQKTGLFYSEPWSCKGLFERGAIDFGQFGICMVSGVPKFFADIGKTTKDINTVTQIIAPTNPAPPVEVKPPVRLPVGREITSTGMNIGSRFNAQITAQQQQVAAQTGGGNYGSGGGFGGGGMSTMTMVAIGGGVAVVGLAGWLYVSGRRAMPPMSR